MNLLLFVLAIIMALSSISYQALQHYQNSAMIRNIWDLYLRRDETCQYNRIVDKVFCKRSKAKPAPTKNQKEEDEDEDEKEEEDAAASKINLRFLLSAKFNAAHPEESQLTENVLKNLIYFLYGEQSFFQEKLAKRPTIVEDLFRALRSTNDALPQKQQIGSIGKLDKLALEDSELQDLWYQLRKENPVSPKVQSILLDKPIAEILRDQESCVDVQIKDFLYQNGETLKIRLWLTPRAILYALLQNEQDVNAIAKMRMQLYREITRGSSKKEVADAKVEFQQFCRQFSPIVAQEKILGFEVSKTDPSCYDL